MEFINVSDTGNFYLNNDTKKYLSELQGPLHIVSVVGRYRTGKSSLLNHLSGKHDIFTTSSSVQAQTKGLGLHIINEDSHTVCLIDSEGFGSVQATKTHDTSIFALAMLVSSGCFFNCLGTITSQNLHDLRLAARVAGMIMSCSKIGISMPPIVWILRDFVLQLRDTHGFNMSPSEYLEECIDQSKQSNESSDLASDIRTLFPERDAMTVPRPCDTEEDLQQMVNIKPSFRTALTEIRERMLKFPPKSRQNRILCGRELCDLVESLCDTLNRNDSVPNMDDMWSSIVQKSLEHATDVATKSFLNETDFVTGVREAYDIFHDKLGQIQPTSEHICNLTFTLLSHTDKIDKSKQELLNLQHSSTLNNEQMNERNKQLTRDLSLCEERFVTYNKRLEDDVKKQLQYESRILELENNIILLNQQVLSLETTETENMERIQERFQQLRKSRDDLQTSVDSLRAEKSQYNSRNDDMKRQVDSSTMKLQSLRKRNDSSEITIGNLHRTVRELKTDSEVWKTRYNDLMDRETNKQNTTNDTYLELLSTRAEVEYLRKVKIEYDDRILTLSQENSSLKHDVKKLNVFRTTYE